MHEPNLVDSDSEDEQLQGYRIAIASKDVPAKAPEANEQSEDRDDVNSFEYVDQKYGRPKE